MRFFMENRNIVKERKFMERNITKYFDYIEQVGIKHSLEDTFVLGLKACIIKLAGIKQNGT